MYIGPSSVANCFFKYYSSNLSNGRAFANGIASTPSSPDMSNNVASQQKRNLNHSAPLVIGEEHNSATVDAVNEKLYTMVAECMAWLSDYEVYPDKSQTDDFFKR